MKQETDVDKKIKEFALKMYGKNDLSPVEYNVLDDYIRLYNKALYTEEDVKKAYDDGFYSRGTDSPVKDSSLYIELIKKSK